MSFLLSGQVHQLRGGYTGRRTPWNGYVDRAYISSFLEKSPVRKSGRGFVRYLYANVFYLIVAFYASAIGAICGMGAGASSSPLWIYFSWIRWKSSTFCPAVRFHP